MRKLSFLIAVLAACGSPPPAIPSAGAPARATTSVVEAPSLPAWPTPAMARTANPRTSLDRVVVSPGVLEEGARIEARFALGPTPRGCEGLDPEARTLGVGDDGRFAVEVGTQESVTICVRDADGHPRATVVSAGARHAPFTSAMWRDGRVEVEQHLEPLDDDVVALVYVSTVRHEDDDGTLPLGVCHTMAASDREQDDPPEYCDYDCSGGHVVLEIPRAAWDAVLASPSYHEDPDEGDDLLYPPTLGLSIPVTLPEGDDAISTCVRTRSGSLVTSDPYPRTIADGPWDGCTFETAAGCLGVWSAENLARGDVLLGLTDDGTVVRAHVRSSGDRDASERLLHTTRGVLTVGGEARVRSESGTDRVASEIAVGERLWNEHGAATVLRIEPHECCSTIVHADLEGATYFLSSGFAIRDDGGAEPIAAPTHVPLGYALAGGDGDCTLEASWPVASMARGVTLHIGVLDDVDHHDVMPGSCSGGDVTDVTIDAATIAAVRAIDADAWIAVQLYGGALECSAPYEVTRCENGAPMGPSMAWTTSAQCVPEGTPIDTPHGRIAIEKLRRGDEVITWSAAHGLDTARVSGSTTHEHRPLVTITLTDGTTLSATPEHLVMAGAAPHAAPMSTLRVGDVVSLHRDGALVSARIASVAPGGEATVVELRVEAPDTYFANGVLVHNY